MYRFHYKEMIAKYGNRVKLSYIDTDSFIYKIETENLYNDLALNLDAYDASIKCQSAGKVQRRMRFSCCKVLVCFV